MPGSKREPSSSSAERALRRSRPPVHARDMDASTFAAILHDLVARVPGAYAATLVDREGETVDYTGHGDPFDLKLAAAHWQIVLAECVRFTAAASFGATRSIVIRGARRSFIIHALPEDYALLVLLGRRAGFSPLTRAFSVCERALIREARWTPPPRPPHSARWFAVTVGLSRAKRPARVASSDAIHDVEVLGALRAPHLASRELGYRVRTPSGLEFTLVREPGGFWYADEDVTVA